MNYRARQIRNMWGKDIAAKEQNWAQERHQYQQDIINLQNSTDAKVIENLEKDLQKKQDLLNQTINLLGPEEIKSLADLQTLLEGKTLKELKESHQKELETKIANLNQEINNLAQQLDQTKQKLIFYTENLKTKESIIAEYQQETKNQAETIEAKDQALAKLQNKQEKLSRTKEKIEAQLNYNLSLKEQKIATLENNLLQLARQKLTNQKQARALVEQIETEWQAKQQQWQELNQQHQNQIQAKDQQITVLQQAQTNLQQMITQLTQNQGQQIQTINNLNYQLTRQKTVLEQLLDRWESELTIAEQNLDDYTDDALPDKSAIIEHYGDMKDFLQSETTFLKDLLRNSHE